MNLIDSHHKVRDRNVKILLLKIHWRFFTKERAKSEHNEQEARVMMRLISGRPIKFTINLVAQQWRANGLI